MSIYLRKGASYLQNCKLHDPSTNLCKIFVGFSFFDIALECKCQITFVLKKVEQINILSLCPEKITSENLKRLSQCA